MNPCPNLNQTPVHKNKKGNEISAIQVGSCSFTIQSFDPAVIRPPDHRLAK